MDFILPVIAGLIGESIDAFGRIIEITFFRHAGL